MVRAKDLVLIVFYSPRYQGEIRYQYVIELWGVEHWHDLSAANWDCIVSPHFQ